MDEGTRVEFFMAEGIRSVQCSAALGLLAFNPFFRNTIWKLDQRIKHLLYYLREILKMARAKLSTTVASETYQFLEQMVERGQAATLAEALDAAITKVRQMENRKRLADATTRYFERLDSQTMAKENALAEDMMSAAGRIDFDKEI